jgi:hypothetical protein
MERRALLKNTALAALGWSISASALSETFMACSTTAKMGGKPHFFSKEQFNLVGEITETMLPRTKTPGAIDLKVPQFIDKIVQDLFDSEGKRKFLADLAELDKKCFSIYGKKFTSCSLAQRTEFLINLDKKSPSMPPNFWGIPTNPDTSPTFYRNLKSLTLWGFYTSQEIGEKVLNFEKVPGRFEGCVPLKEVGNSWNE